MSFSVLAEPVNPLPQQVQDRMPAALRNAAIAQASDAAERRMIEELRQMGHAALTAWARNRVVRCTAEAGEEPEGRSGGKKKLHWHTTFGVIAVEEPLRRVGTRIERPFSKRAGVECRATSRPLQRVLADFGAEVAFGRVPDKLREHDGIVMPVSTIQRITERHAEAIRQQEAAQEVEAGTAAGLFIGEIDGSMVPVVEASPEAGDKPKGKALCWKEVRLCLVYPQGGATPVFGGHVAGGTEESGRQWERCAAKAAFGPASHLHAVGDGAPWIATQVDTRFGARGSFLVDFFHLCEYLGEAAKVCAANDPRAWVDQQKTRLKANRADAVLEALAPFVNKDGDDGPATACDRYLRNRLDQVDYQAPSGKACPSVRVRSRAPTAL